jgi:uncharacterized protein (TIGR00369 family)
MAVAKMSVAELEKFLHDEFPQAFRGGDITIESADGETCLLRQRYNDQMLRPGGTVSGPTLMAMADFAMYVVLLSAIGPVGLAVTTNLNINFLRKGRPGQDVLAAAKLLKLGKRLAARSTCCRARRPIPSPMSRRPIPFQIHRLFRGIIAPYS